MGTSYPQGRVAVLDRLGAYLQHQTYPMLTWTLLAEGTRDVWRARAAAVLDVIGCDGTNHQADAANTPPAGC